MAIHGSGYDGTTRLMRRLTAGMVVVFSLFLASFWFLAPPQAVPAYFDHTDCRRVGVIDNQTGLPVLGAEDIALHPGGGALILSAHDRRRPDENGALYELTLFGLTAMRDVSARRLTSAPLTRERFRPHGISISPDGARMAVVNRFAPNSARIDIGPLTSQGWFADRRVEGRDLCRANDVFLTGLDFDDMLVTLDRADCESTMRDLSPWATTGRIARFDGNRLEVTRTLLSFPNGIVNQYIAETRMHRLLRQGAEPIDLPGAPDNLSIGPDDTVIAALHPKLLHLWLYQNQVQSRAPSRIVQIMPETDTVAVLFDDPEGRMFSAATSAVYTGGLLVAGSVADAGLLVCRKGS